MSVRVECTGDELAVSLGGIDRVLNARSSVRVARESVADARVARRGDLEHLIDHRVVGIGPHAGSERPSRRRVGTMMGRGVVGRQFWAVEAGDAEQRLVVVDTVAGTDPARLVLAAPDPDGLVHSLLGRT